MYDTPVPRYIGVLYTVGKLIVPAFHWAGGHDRVFMFMVATPIQGLDVALFIDLLQFKVTDPSLIKIFSQPDTSGCLATFSVECMAGY